MGLAMAQAASHQPLNVGAQVQFQASPCDMCGRQSGTARDFALSTLVLPCQYHSTTIQFSCIHLAHTPYNLANDIVNK